MPHNRRAPPPPGGDPTHCPSCGCKLEGRLDAHQGSRACDQRKRRFDEDAKARRRGLVLAPEGVDIRLLNAWNVDYHIVVSFHQPPSYFVKPWVAAVASTSFQPSDKARFIGWLRSRYVRQKEIAALSSLGGTNAVHQYLMDNLNFER